MKFLVELLCSIFVYTAVTLMAHAYINSRAATFTILTLMAAHMIIRYIIDRRRSARKHPTDSRESMDMRENR